MNATVEEIIRHVRASGIILLADPPDLVVGPVEKLTVELEEQLRRNKEAILRHFKLQESMRRLETTNVCIAVWEDGSMRVVVNQGDKVQAIDQGGVVYSPADMWHYIQLEPHDRRMLR